MSLNQESAIKFCKTFSCQLSAGTPYPIILSKLIEQGVPRRGAVRLERKLLEESLSLSQAISEAKLLDDTRCLCIQSGEASGDLPRVFKELASELEEAQKSQKKIFGESLSLWFMIAVGLPFYHVMGVLRGFDVEGMWGKIPLELLCGVVEGGLLLAFVYALFYVWLALPLTSRIRWLSSRLLWHLPLFSTPLKLYAIAEFCRYFKGAIHSGLPMREVITHAANGTRDPRSIAQAHDAWVKVEEGEALGESLRKITLLPSDLCDQIGAAEYNGRLEQASGSAFNDYRGKAEEALETVLQGVRLAVMGLSFAAFMAILCINLMHLLEHLNVVLA